MSKAADGVNLRYGYTTGACAAAAARAAATCLVKQERVTGVTIELPGRGSVPFVIHACDYNDGQATCSVIKDAGDDPDITDGIEVYATVIGRNEPGITLRGGIGVGTVTKPGLEIAPGLPAINPVPRRMILESVENALVNSHLFPGAEVIISVPNGEKISKKTLNHRLGIVGGISILGTSGIVIPYSEAAYQASISQALDVAVAAGCPRVVITTGRRSEKFAQAELKLPEECFVQTGDYIGYSLGECAVKGIAEAVIWGMTGKISKLAAGHLYTNISDSAVDIGMLVKIAAACGAPSELNGDLQRAVTANQLRRLLPEEVAPAFCERLCRLAAEACQQQTGGGLKIACIMSDYHGEILGKANAN